MRILVIEDELALCRLLQRALEAQGYAVDVAVDGLVGLACAQGGGYQAIILDLGLPDLDGLEVCRRLRAADVPTPILMLTARRQLEDRVRGLDGGADAYLGKPFALAELLARLRALARRPTDACDDRALCLHDLVLDTRTYQAQRGERAIPLTRTEYLLLEFLLRHAGQVLSRQQILDHVWSCDFAGTDAVLDTYIRYLRAKIDRDADRPLLQTVRGVGYVLRAVRADADDAGAETHG